MKHRKLSAPRLLAKALVWSALTTAALGLVSACGGSDEDSSSTSTPSGSAGASGNGGASGSGGNAGAAGSGAGYSGETGWALTADGGQVQVTSGGISVTDDNGTFICYQTTCEGHLLECGDCEDNDGDGVVDWRDRECLGPCDNTEGPALTAGVGGENGGACKADCYFDFGNGSGNDDCMWDHRCDPLSVDPEYHPEGEECAYEESRVGSKDCPDNQSETCLDYCRPLTPNGCDCFGCCTFPELNGGFVWIGSVEPDDSNIGSCTFDEVTNTTNCEPCTPVDDCFNDCGYCEICLGKPTVPEECLPDPDAGVPAPYPDAGPPIGARCEPGIELCGLDGEAPCEQGYYCITGCCEPILR